MLKCGTFRCDGPPVKQCDNCNKSLFCENCILVHSSEHLKDNVICNFTEIKLKLSKIDFTRLKSTIKLSIYKIEIQKKQIMNEALSVSCQIKFMVKSAFKHLDEMTEYYNELYKKTEFKAKDHKKIKSIISEDLLFEKPSFSKLEGTLTKNTKNTKNQIKSVDMKQIQDIYDLITEMLGC
ncbi:hypothetical protein SteCoe_30946 [Stentor coeruleus]|uniref:C2H2-type domain-containing protein n=1 Tax=Stentor coeruleus TaxID=5963 RepID=A0A1R2B2E8_9CILI|nr:hypothetical protein SteCoe_30946 [Stentor coeruleus]